MSTLSLGDIDRVEALDGTRLVPGSHLLGVSTDGALLYDSVYSLGHSSYVVATDVKQAHSECWVTTADNAFCRVGADDVQLELGGAHAKQVAATYDNACVLVTDGSVRCWSFTITGMLSRSSVVIDGITDATQLALASTHDIGRPDVPTTTGCAILADRTVRCWGDNYYGQVGNGSRGGTVTTAATVLDGDNDNKPLTNVVAIAIGDETTLALLADGTVYTWGENAFASPDRQSVATRVPDIEDASTIAAGDWLDCALVYREIVCWGGSHREGIDFGFVTPYG